MDDNGDVGAVLVLLLLSAACLATPGGTDPPTVPTAVSQDAQEIELRVGGSAPVHGTGATVRFDGVSDDSRCPRGATCVWEGDAIVELSVSGEGGGSPETVRLHANARFSQQARALGVTLTLVRLEPLPEADRPVPPGAYSAAIRVTR